MDNQMLLGSNARSKISFVLFTSLLLCGIQPVFSENPSVEIHLNSLVRYVKDGTLGACPSSDMTLADTSRIDKPVKDYLPLADIQAIEIQGDSIRLPSAIVVRALAFGKFVKWEPRTFGQAVAACIWFKNGSKLPITFFPMSGQVFNQAKIGNGWLTLSELHSEEFSRCVSDLKKLELRHTKRREFERLFHVDGGISTPYRAERYVFSDVKSQKLVPKVNAVFKPASMSEQVYEAESAFVTHSQSWTARQQPDDILMNLSPVYLEEAFFD